MADIKRKMVKVKTSIDLYGLADGELNDVRKYIDQLAAEYGENARLKLDWHYDSIDAKIEYERLETEQEAQKRAEAAKKARARRKASKLKAEERERKELARLLKKYG